MAKIKEILNDCASEFAVRGFSGALRHEVNYMGKDVKGACAFPAGIKTAIAANTKIDVPCKSNLGEDQQKVIAEASFLTTPEHATADILNGVRKGRVRIKVGKRSTLIDLVLRLFSTNYGSLFFR